MRHPVRANKYQRACDLPVALVDARAFWDRHCQRLGFTALIVAAILVSGCNLQRENITQTRLPPPKGKVPSGELMAELHLYPSGVFQQAWIEAARPADAAILSATPRGLYLDQDGRKTIAASKAFTSLGPKPIQTVEGPAQNLRVVDANSGRVNDIVVQPEPLQSGNPNSYRAFLATDGGGVWRSDNCCFAGTQWTPVTDGQHIPSLAIGDLAIDPNAANTIYAGTGDLRFGSYSFGSAGLLKSIDAGNSWRVLGADVFAPPLPVGEPNYSQYQAIGKVVVDPNNSQRVVVGTKTGLFFSHDAGETWSGPCYSNSYAQGTNAQRQDITALEAVAIDSTSTWLYAGVGTRGGATPVQPDLDKNGANGLYRTSMPSTASCPDAWQKLTRPDNGWPENYGNGQPLGPIGRIELAIAPSNPNVLYVEAISAIDYSIAAVWRSADAGASWQMRATPAQFSDCEPGAQNWYNAGISVHPSEPDTVFLSSYWLYRSTDGGANFKSLNCVRGVERTHIDQHARAFVGNDPNRLLIGNDGGVYYTGNALAAGPSFQWLNDSLNAVELYAGDISANFSDASSTAARYIVAGAQDNGTSLSVQGGTPSANAWQSVWGGDGITARIEPVLGKRFYYSSQRGRMVATTNGPGPATIEAAGPWNPGEIGPESKSFLTVFDLYRYGDLNVPNSGCTAQSGCTHLIAATTRVWESTNGAIANTEAGRFTAISADLTKGNLILGTDRRSVINHLAYAPSDRRIAMVGTQDGNVWMGFNLGSRPALTASWKNITGNNSILPNRAIMKVAADPVTPTTGYAAVGGFSQNTPSTPGHVFQVRCNIDCSVFNWRNISGNLPEIPANAVMVNPWLPQQVFVGTDWGLYFTDNVEADAPVWQRFEGLPRAMVWDLQVDRGFTTLAVFTRGRGAWVWPLPRVAAQPNLAGLWYKPGEDGWGLTVAHQGELLFPVWYTFDANGRPIWHTANAARQSDGSYQGDVFEFRGTPFNLIQGPASQPATVIGSARFTLQNNGLVDFSYNIKGVAQSKLIQRFAPGPLPVCRFTTLPLTSARNHTEIWWSEAEPGWGMYLTESGRLIYLTWYTYASDGAPMWVTGLLERSSDSDYHGSLTRPLTGTAFSAISGPATSFPVPTVGSASLSFTDGESALFRYQLDGVTQEKQITRVRYAGPERTVCE